MRPFLILGKGYIGAQLVGRLRQTGFTPRWLSKADIDYTCESTLTSFLKGFRGTVINCTGYTGTPNVDTCELFKNETYYYNVIVPQIIQRACENQGIRCIHIGSGCIYTGFDELFTEQHIPNFGIYNDQSSFYSKTKHMFELSLQNMYNPDYWTILRIRMPLSHIIFKGEVPSKNFFNKISSYKNILNVVNSKTSIELIAQTVNILHIQEKSYGLLNCAHPFPLSTNYVINELIKSKTITKSMDDFIFYDEEDFYEIMKLKANRSSCALDTNKIEKLFNDHKMNILTEQEYLTTFLGIPTINDTEVK